MKHQQLAISIGLSLLAFANCTFANQVNSIQVVSANAEETDSAFVAAKEQAEKEAQLAYQKGLALYGENSNETAKLAINYAKAINSYVAKNLVAIGYGNEEKRFDLYSQAHRILVKNYGENSIETMDTLLAKATHTNKSDTAVKNFKQLIKIAELQNNPGLVANMQFEAAETLLYGFSHSEYSLAKIYAQDADKYYQAQLPDNAVERIKSDLLMVSFESGRKDYDKATKRLNRIVGLFDKYKNLDQSFELNAHVGLVQLYEKQDESDKATKHALAFAKNTHWKNTSEQNPLYITEPIYPRGETKSHVIVILEITVDTHGFVKNPKVISSEGSKAFEKSAIAAVKQWRYAPKFKNGKPVNATTQAELYFERL